VDKAQRAVAEEHEEVVELGGLYVLGTGTARIAADRPAARPVRAPGRPRRVPVLPLRLKTHLMRMFNSDKVAHFMEWLRKTPPEVLIESKAVSRSIRSAQTQVEQQNFEIRKDVLKHDDVLNRQRKVIYGEREVLEGADLHEQIRQMIDEVVTAYVSGATEDGFPRNGT
jgi:preprotein translocase subunit SecA